MSSNPSPIDGAVLCTADAPSARPALAAPVTGTCWFVDQTTGQPVDGTITHGCLTVTGFVASDGALRATGTLAGSCTAVDGTGPTVTQEVTTTVGVAVTGGPGTCWVLRLEFGDIDLDRRQLVVHTDEVVITVAAESGPGHLPGNLLWAVDNSLRSGAPAAHVAELLNTFLTVSG